MKVISIYGRRQALINVPSDDTALPEMLTHALLHMPAREPDIAGVTSRTVNFCPL